MTQAGKGGGAHTQAGLSVTSFCSLPGLILIFSKTKIPHPPQPAPPPQIFIFLPLAGSGQLFRRPQAALSLDSRSRGKAKEGDSGLGELRAPFP